MVDYRTMYDKDYIGAWDFKGDTVVTILDVQAKKIKNVQTNKEDKKPIITLDGYEKRWVCNVTNGALIASLYGTHVEKWHGKKITLYPTQVQAFGRMQDCIRVRPQAPEDSKRADAGKELVILGITGTPVGKPYAKASEWLDALHAAIQNADGDNRGKLYDANREQFDEIAKNPKAAELCAKINELVAHGEAR